MMMIFIVLVTTSIVVIKSARGERRGGEGDGLRLRHINGYDDDSWEHHRGCYLQWIIFLQIRFLDLDFSTRGRRL